MMRIEISSKRVHILVLELLHTTTAIEQMRRPNEHTYQPQMKYLTISVELCKQLRIFVYAYANYHVSCIGFARE